MPGASVGAPGCVYNYYAIDPCLDAKRQWLEFVGLHGLEAARETAAIFQAYKEGKVVKGDRLMARAQGLPDPDGQSAFTLQGEVAAMNLQRLQRSSAKEPCSLNPYEADPCPGVLEIYEDFVKRHDLPAGRDTAGMFEAYSKGNFQHADVIYARAAGKPVPAYGYLPTGVVADPRVAAALKARQRSGGKEPCDLSPHGLEPCPGVTRLWREFAATYKLDDTADNARIFAAYGQGDVRQGDRLLAAAKNVSVELLREAAGVPLAGPVIEVYPGRGGGWDGVW